MRDYIKPIIEEEEIEIEDVIAISGPKDDPFDLSTDDGEGELL